MKQVSMRAVVAGCLALAIVGGAAWVAYSWRGGSAGADATEPSPAGKAQPGAASVVRLSRQARENLGLTAKPLELTTYWRSIDLPGVVVDRPGVSDRGVVAPVTGVVAKINAFPGDTVEPRETMFAIRLVSESLHKSQMELFKAMRDIEIAKAHLKRLSGAAETGVLPGSRIIAIENEIKRFNVAVEAYRQDLLARGLNADEVDSAANGKFITEIAVHAPQQDLIESSTAPHVAYEVESLAVELGQQVDAGQLLAELADHRELFVEGRAFKDDLPLVQKAAQRGWPVEVDWDDDEAGDWPAAPTRLPIHHVANSVDPETRTFAFYATLANQSQSYATADGATRYLWRFRPGGRMRLRTPVEQLENVFVVPRAAVVQEGPETYVFRQNGELFDRRPVRVLYEDRLYTVLANDGSVSPGFYVAQSSAASLNRILKAQSASGMPANVHVHADGTVHEAH